MSPAEAYSSRLAARELRARQLEAAQQRVGAIRLLLAAIAILLAWMAWYERRLSPLWVLLPAAVFAIAAACHAVLRRRHSRAVRAVSFYQRGLARIEDRWAGSGRRGERFNNRHHVYAADLDLFGEGSLFELLCAARTRMGEEWLAAWLLAPAPLGEVRERHACLADLRERLDLREELAMLGGDAEAAIQPEALVSWAEAPGVLEGGWLRWLACGLPALLAASAIAGELMHLWIPFWAILALEAAALYGLRSRLDQVLGPAEVAFDVEDLKTLIGLLLRIEGERFDSIPMQALAGALSTAGARASGAMGRLATIVALAESRRNLVVRWLLAVPLLYVLHVALAAERWRRVHGEAVRGWVEAAGRFEALSSLAQYGFEHPEDPVPELIEGRACLQAEGIGHPLIPLSRCVRNDVSLAGPTRILLVSGSNMSGKSTLLRAVGMNVVLAMAGAPVRARSLELTPLRIGACIRLNDSLREGSSRFYAEITRLRKVNEIAERGLPLLFLLDEMLQGTNSWDRRIGAEGVLRALVEHGAVGLVTTHDLALTELQGLGEGVLRNVHFDDRLEEGRMSFDFELRDGIVAKSNGLELMRAIGLRV